MDVSSRSAARRDIASRNWGEEEGACGLEDRSPGGDNARRLGSVRLQSIRRGLLDLICEVNRLHGRMLYFEELWV